MSKQTKKKDKGLTFKIKKFFSNVPWKSIIIYTVIIASLIFIKDSYIDHLHDKISKARLALDSFTFMTNKGTFNDLKTGDCLRYYSIKEPGASGLCYTTTVKILDKRVTRETGIVYDAICVTYWEKSSYLEEERFKVEILSNTSPWVLLETINLTYWLHPGKKDDLLTIVKLKDYLIPESEYWATLENMFGRIRERSEEYPKR